MLETTTSNSTTTTTMNILHINEKLTAVSAVQTTTSKSESVDYANNKIFVDKNNSKQQQKSPNTTIKTNIFNWLKGATATTTTSATSTTTSNNENSKSNAKTPDESLFRDFRGVQSLRSLWNKRISAINAESTYNKNNNHKLTKSISCLVNATNSSGENNNDASTTSSSSSTTKARKSRPDRAQSLHDCRHFGRDFVDDCLNSTTDIDTLHRVKDNFYKYKTAEQAAAHLVREAYARANVKKHQQATGNGNVDATNNIHAAGNTHFPAFTKNDKGASHIHWSKRCELNRNIKRKTTTEKETTAAPAAEVVTSMTATDCSFILSDSNFNFNSKTNMAIREKHTTSNSAPDNNNQKTTMASTKANEILSAIADDLINDCTNPTTTEATATASATALRHVDKNKSESSVAVENVLQNIVTTKSTSTTSASTPLSQSSSSSDLVSINSITPLHGVSSQIYAESLKSSKAQKKKRKGSLDSTSSPGRESLTNGSGSAGGGGGRKTSARRTASTASNSSSNGGGSGARKYSFKTHSRSYHIPRKMQTHRDSSTIGINSNTNSSSVGGSNLVAKLTQQFNNMIQKDKSLLDEVKRKNGVLLTRGGHVYKVIDKNDPQQFSNNKTTTATATSASPAISRTSSRGSKDSTKITATKIATTTSSPRSSVVQRNIKKFELNQKEKPKVPLKSSSVLRKYRELILNNENQRELNKSKRQALNLSLVTHTNKQNINNSSSSSTIDAQQLQQQPTSASLKKLTHSILLSPPPLEVVKEESKTPLENEDKIGSFIKSNNNNSSNLVIKNKGQKQQQVVVKEENTNNGTFNATYCVILNDEADEAKNVNNKNDERLAGYSTVKRNKNSINETKSPTKTESNDGNVGVVNTKATTTTRTSSIMFTDTYETTINKNEATPKTLASTSPTPTTNDQSQSNQTANNDNNKQRSKNKYSKIYERFRFRSPFGSGSQSKKQLNSPTKEAAPTTPTKVEEEKTPTMLSVTSSTTESIESIENLQEPEAFKLIDALEAIDEKIKGLTAATKKANNIQQPQPQQTAEAIIYQIPAAATNADDDFEENIKPNDSFIYKACARQVCSNNQLLLTQAVNVALVNSIEGEQMILEQKDIKNLNEQVKTAATTIKEEETIYEPIMNEKSSNESKKTEIIKTPTEMPSTTTTLESSSFVFKQQQQQQEQKPKAAELNLEMATKSFLYSQSPSQQKATDNLIVEDLYQTLEETIKNGQQSTSTTRTATVVEYKMHSDCSQNDYESIAGSCEQSNQALLQVIKTTTANDGDGGADDGGYEVYEPAPEIMKTPLTTTNTRNTNDELPELPKPKRRLPKSPMPSKRPLPPTLDDTINSKIVAATATLELTNSKIQNNIDDNDDHHYYADDENIYDIIRGSHCYESVHAELGGTGIGIGSDIGRKLQTISTTTSSILSTTGKCLNNGDNDSLISNCYESITHYRRVALTNNGANATGSSSGSTLTISSDHKTNSLYEVSLAANLHCNGNCGNGGGIINGSPLNKKTLENFNNVQYSKHSGYSSVNSSKRLKLNKAIAKSASSNDDVAGMDIGVGIGMGVSNDSSNQSQTVQSDNSDEWIDVTESETDEEDKKQFIVVRERFKVHRSPDWSKRVRDKRLQKKKAMSCIEDDSDHYYETLSPLGNKRHSMQLSMQTQKHNSSLGNVYNGDPEQTHKKPYASAHALGTFHDFDSFDSDTDGYCDTEQGTETKTSSLTKNHHDSGVDIRNVKLPEPPPSTNQVYAIVKKLKKFISNKKSPNSGTSSKSGSGRQQKIYENTSQFYVEDTIYRNTPKSKSLPKINAAKKSTTATSPATPTSAQEDYENTEFHTPPQANVTSSDMAVLSTSEKNLNNDNSSNTHISHTDLVLSTQSMPRSKAKSGKSFKSRLRKSLVGSNSDCKQQMSGLTPTRSTFYVEDPNNLTYGELDSGFSEKASSGDLPVSGTVGIPTAEIQKFSTVARKAKKDIKSSQRRRTTIGIRPHEPPPPPPEDLVKTKYEKSTTSWYTECGVFKNGAIINSGDGLDENLQNCGGVGGGNKSNPTYNHSNSTITSGTSWYTEAGLYQTSGVSVASSSGSSGVSTGNETGLGDDLTHSLFMNEPLYQIYNAAKLESISRGFDDTEGSTDGYEEIGHHHENENKIDEEVHRRSRPTALQLVGPKTGPSRTLWSEIPEVINSCILPTLTPRERALQEAKFEILTSEASYLKSLNLLRTHFMNHPMFRDTNIVSGRDRKALFSYIVPVHECSERLLTELESCWQDNIMLLGLSKRIYTVAEKYFHVYIAFCEHQGRMDRTLRNLKDSKGIFAQNLDLLESSPTCCGLNLHSFLMLPMQRITRLPLLIDAVFSKVSPNDDEYDNWKMTLAIMNKIVTQCNEAANRCEQAYEIERISRQLEFPTTIRALAIAPVGVPAPGSKPRYLVKKGELTHLIWRGDDTKLTFGKKFTKAAIYAFLFTDLLVLTKRKNEEQFTVFDYCPRNMLTISTSDALSQLPTKDLNQTGKNLILMTLLENHERKTLELVLSCPSVSEQERWLQAMRPPEAETPGEKLYEQWDCPQVIAKHSYEANEPDVLNLEVGDVINVTRKLPDGWYQGERLRDGATGWFPGSFTEEVNSAHVRARNLKQRYRLLTFTATYLESRKQK